VGGYLFFEIPGFGGKKNSENRPENWKISRTGIQSIFKRTGTAISQFFKRTGTAFPSSSRRTGTLEFLKKRSGPTIRFQVPILF
jgi:hypothetical protein